MCDRASEILGYDLLDVRQRSEVEARRHGVRATRAVRGWSRGGGETASGLPGRGASVLSRRGSLSRRVHRARVRRRDVVRGRSSSGQGARRVDESRRGRRRSRHALRRGPRRRRAADVRRGRERHLVETDDGSDADNLVCEVANYLFPQGRVVSGDRVALEEVTKRAVAAGALKCAPVAVSGAFHTSRMASARDALVEALANVTVSAPKIPVYSNATARSCQTRLRFRSFWPNSSCRPCCGNRPSSTSSPRAKMRCTSSGPTRRSSPWSSAPATTPWKKFKNVDVAK